jgi:hypothetical protein
MILAHKHNHDATDDPGDKCGHRPEDGECTAEERVGAKDRVDPRLWGGE